jgi:hypothetical protein
MVRFTLEAVLPTDARRYFIEKDTPAFNALKASVLGLGALEFVDSWQEGDKKFVKLLTKPDVGKWVS